MTYRLHSGDARRYVRMAQLAGVAVGVSAAALWALDVPGLVYREPTRPQLPEQQIARPSEDQAPRFDRERTGDMGVRLELARKAAPKTQTPDEPAKHAEPPPVQPSSGPIITYLGCIYEGSRMLAVLSVDGRQRIVPEGRSLGDARVVSIAEGHVELQDASGRRTIPRGERTASAVSWISNMPSSAPVAANIPGQNGARGGRQAALSAALSPEMEQRFRERGMDPAQVQRWREAVRQREAQRANAQAAPMPAPVGTTDGSMQDADGLAVIVTPGDDATGDETKTQIFEDDQGNLVRMKWEQEGREMPEDGETRP